jgi:DNA-binding transcriptional regulator PaaX
MRERRNRKARIGSTQKKVLLLLIAGAALGLSHSPRRRWRILKEVSKEWQAIDRASLGQATKKLHTSQLIVPRKKSDGTYALVLTQKGATRAQEAALETLAVTVPHAWDGVWHLALFDIPEYAHSIRDGFRFHLKRLGFFEVQQSVFVHPYPCLKEIETLVDFYGVRKHVCTIETQSISCGAELRKHFNLHK